MARITVEDCIDKFSSRFELVLVASQRAKKLYTGEQPTVEKENDKNTVIALREIADMSIPINVMKDSLVAEYQTISVLEEEEIENIESTEDNYITTTENISSEQDINQQVDDEIKSLNSTEDQANEEHYSIDEEVHTDKEKIIQDVVEEENTSSDS